MDNKTSLSFQLVKSIDCLKKKKKKEPNEEEENFYLHKSTGRKTAKISWESPDENLRHSHFRASWETFSLHLFICIYVYSKDLQAQPRYEHKRRDRTL